MRGRVEHRRVAVGVGEGFGQRAGRQPLQLGEDAADGLLVQFVVRRLAEQVLAPQHLEQVELDVPQVALVVAHRCSDVLPDRLPGRLTGTFTCAEIYATG